MSFIKDFWYGKPHTAEEGGRRLGDNYLPKTGLYKHREWRGVKDTFYYFHNIWLYNYLHMVTDVIKYGGIVNFVKGVWRYRWVGQTYLPVLHWFDRGLEGLRGEALRASAWHYRAMVNATIYQFMTMFNADTRLHGGKKNDAWYHTMAMKETTWGGMFYGWSDKFKAVSLEMIPYFVTCHVNSHTVHNYIDAVQSIGLPGDPCPMCQAESGLFVLDDIPDYSPFMITCNEACDGSVATAILQDWFNDKPMYALQMPMQFDDPLANKFVQKDIEKCWKFIEEQTGMPFDYDCFVKYIERYNELTRFEHEKWDVAANSPYYPICGSAQALYRIYYSQAGWRDIWAQTDKRVKKILHRCVEKKINCFPEARHRVIAWSCAPLYYSFWPTWAYNCWGLQVVINMDSLMFDIDMRTDTREHLMEDFTLYNEWAPMRRMAVGGYKHILSSGKIWSASTATW